MDDTFLINTLWPFLFRMRDSTNAAAFVKLHPPLWYNVSITLAAEHPNMYRQLTDRYSRITWPTTFPNLLRLYSVDYFPEQAQQELRSLGDICSLSPQECWDMSVLFGFLEIEAKRLETSKTSEPERRAKLMELARQYYQFYAAEQETARDMALLRKLLWQMPANSQETTFTSEARRKAVELYDYEKACMYKRAEEEELDEIWADFDIVEKQTQAAVKRKLSAPQPPVAPDTAEDPVPWTRMSKQEMLAHFRANVQHMVERHGAKEPEYSKFWWPPIVYDPEPQKPKLGTEADTEEFKRFKREHPKKVEDWEKAIAEREKKREKEDEAVSKRFKERRNERKALAERIEERDNKRKKAQVEAIESIKRRYQNGSLVRDVGSSWSPDVDTKYSGTIAHNIASTAELLF
ncbi:hypothetical protein R1sor_005703 [Riccia sorocarpa]|uniref:Uncharacterized protein n=1 Tax=Riccia sorocarpa TaxID=122646 RepID=A0ABD3HNV5_9MARC